MVFIVMAFVVFLLFYSLTYSKSENKRKNQHKKYMSMIREEKNSDKNNYQWENFIKSFLLIDNLNW